MYHKTDKYNILRWAVTGRDDNKMVLSVGKFTSILQQKNKNLEYWKDYVIFVNDFRPL